MDKSRRRFIQIAGFSLAALGLRPAGALAKKNKTPNPQAFRGGRWVMVVDPAKGDENLWRACAEACHRAHNVPDIPDKEEEIKWVWTEPYANAFPGQHHEYVGDEIKEKPFLVLCNHCANPPCVRVCPTQATFKRKEDGIVMMDFHRCIGCRFCMAACPYGSRSFNWSDPRRYWDKAPNPDFPTRAKGVVEKCNFCLERLAKGQPPACTEACAEMGSDALVFGDLDNPASDVRRLLRRHYTIRRKPELGTNPGIYYIV
ncbi:MAG: 4Fe-4S dicluster domain-containing protein [Deltaproteobacteria bacterium]|nr:4Fe-4S dicluster domain-containing protein [Deltaproteobacteria bacterium]